MTAHDASSGPASTDRAVVDAGVPRVRVLLPLPLVGAYDYAVPPGLALEPGAIVRVPLGRREEIGVVWDDPPASRHPDRHAAAPTASGGERVAAARLRPVLRRCDVPALPAVARAFIDWVAAYTMSPPGAVLRMTLREHGALEPPAPQFAWRRADSIRAAGRKAEAAGAGPEPFRLTPPRRRVLERLAEGPPLPTAELARAAGCGIGVVTGLAAAGWLVPVPMPPRPPFAVPDWRRPGLPLAPAQQAAAVALATRIRSGGDGAVLLDGVTGSGKTEVYFEAVAATLAAGRQVLVLLPEIALSAQWLERFAERFGAAPAEWHSDLTGVRRRLTWRAVAEGTARVVVGARSALFLPYPDLGLIIVDEEHEAAYKQEDGVIYHARDMAVVRARLGRIPVVLVSATPSLETTVNTETGRYDRLHLPERHGGAALPAITAVDLRVTPPPRGRFLSPPLLQALTATLAAGEQAMLFLNRRGYAPLTLCRSCGARLECPNCTAWLVEHRLAGRLMCHHCGHAEPMPRHCPECSAEGTLSPCGPGVERIAEEVAELLPAARVAVMTSDLIHGPADAAMLVARVAAREIDLLIGTQLVAKGHHFPFLTLVGVVDADLGLSGGDLRASERTYQLLHQVAGRAGRAERAGQVLLQTWRPEHPVIAALVAGDRDGFLAAEKESRRLRGWPPFGRLAALIVSAGDAAAADRAAGMLGRTAPQGEGLQVLGPAEAPLALLRGRHRRRLLVKAERRVRLQSVLARWLAGVPVTGDVRIAVDIDPYSFL